VAQMGLRLALKHRALRGVCQTPAIGAWPHTDVDQMARRRITISSNHWQTGAIAAPGHSTQACCIALPSSGSPVYSKCRLSERSWEPKALRTNRGLV
jgi:hypothetical protein